MRGAETPAVGWGPAAGSSSQVGQHGIDQTNNHQHPHVWIEAASGQTNHLASAAGHHAETQHHRPAGTRTGLAATRRPSLVVQKICRIAGAVDVGRLSSLVARMSGAISGDSARHPRQPRISLRSCGLRMGHSPVERSETHRSRHREWDDGFRCALPILLLCRLLLCQQRLADLLEFAAVGLVDLGKMQVQSVERTDDRRADHHAGEPFVVSGHDVPGRVLR
jgi:hypothetical protein